MKLFCIEIDYRSTPVYIKHMPMFKLKMCVVEMQKVLVHMETSCMTEGSSEETHMLSTPYQQ